MIKEFKVRCLLTDLWVYNKIPENTIIKGSTLCLYTGFSDSNSKKIFEGDIIKHIYNESNYLFYKVLYINKKFMALQIKDEYLVELKDLIYNYNILKEND
ncbi:YopX family protein [Faecalimicrobium sp. JNUCC 81]